MIELDDIERALRAATVAVVGEGPCSGSRLTRAVVDRSRRYTSDRGQLAVCADADADLAARALFFTVADVDKVATPLAAWRPSQPLERLSVLELGAGCGALSLGLLRDLSRGGVGRGHVPLQLTLVDHDARALAIATRAIHAVADTGGFAVSVSTVVADLGVLATPTRRLPGADAHCVLIGSVLNELAPQARLPLMTAALSAVTTDGVVIAVEPALAATSRDLHRVRDALVDAGAVVVAPCTHQNPCPMLQREREWCHEDRPATLPERVRQLATTTGLRDAGLKFSYLVVRAGPAPVTASSALRVVARPRHEKGRIELSACGAEGLVPLRLLRRNRSNANRAFEDARRGDLLEIVPAPTGGELKEDSEVRVVHHR